MIFATQFLVPLQHRNRRLGCRTGTSLFREGDRLRAACDILPRFRRTLRSTVPASPATLSGVSVAGQDKYRMAAERGENEGRMKIVATEQFA
ncbi:hypothetical protein C0075_06790 [Rhizobium sp. KAs_5_22]|nr:hypothetical protein C0075_06790 [Rhizobium sp. KAs_5_22]